MNILFLNNYNYIRGGAESVFLEEMKLMERHGHVPIVYSRQHELNKPYKFDSFFPKSIKTDSFNYSWESLKTVKTIIYSHSAKSGLKGLLQQARPNIAHAHNIYGRLTTSVLDVLREREIPVVMTLHDPKLICPNYKFMYDHHICEDCKGHSFYKAIINKCHKNSYAASTVYAIESYFNSWFNKYSKNIKIFLSPSLFLKKKLIEFGWPDYKVHHVPNFITLDEFEPNYEKGNYFLYLGRLSEEKGILTLIKAFTRLKSNYSRLIVVGDGPLKEKLIEISNGDKRIIFKGYLSGSELRTVTRNALAVILPSVCYENAPISLLEAMAFGKPVIGARIGGIPEMIDDGVNGFLFESGNESYLADVLERMLLLPKESIIDMGKASRGIVEKNYHPELHYQRLMQIYNKILVN